MPRVGSRRRFSPEAFPLQGTKSLKNQAPTTKRILSLRWLSTEPPTAGEKGRAKTKRNRRRPRRDWVNSCKKPQLLVKSCDYDKNSTGAFRCQTKTILK